MTTTPAWIGGAPALAQDGTTMDVLNPATAAVIAEVPLGTVADVDAAVAAAERARRGWERATPGARGEALLALADLVLAHREELGAIESRNVGKPLDKALEEMDGTADILRFFAGAARTMTAPAAGEYATGRTSFVRREPVGIVGVILPWNYPLMMAAYKLGPALAAGNTVVAKPSEQTPLSLLRLVELAADVLPPGVLNVVTGEGETVGAAIAAHPGIAMVALTGDVGTGRLVARGASASLKRVHLELGGKAPAIILDDADPEVVAEALVVAGYWNSGQDCLAACRVIAGPRIHDGLVHALVRAVEGLVTGDPAGGVVDMGPVITAGQRDRVLGFVERAAADGADVLTGGGGLPGDGFFVTPTVVAGPAQSSEIVQREIFGPVITVQRAADDAEALAWANDVSYGLGASVWGSDITRLLRLTRELRFGAVWVNEHAMTLPEMPHGGRGDSGYGTDLSVAAIEEHTQLKHVMIGLGGD